MSCRTVVIALLAAAGVLAGCPTSPHINPQTQPVALTPAEGGYELSGPYDIEGTLKYEPGEPGQWRLTATLTFPTGGYRVGEVETMIMESYPEQVTITIPVAAPSPDSIVTQVITQQTAGAVFQASGEAQCYVFAPSFTISPISHDLQLFHLVHERPDF